MTLSLSDRDAIDIIGRSDLVTAPLDMVRTQIAGGFIDQTRDRPNFWHGNRIVLNAPPAKRDYQRWIARHREAFAWREQQLPVVVTWYERYVARPHESRDESIERSTGFLAPLAPPEPPRPVGLQSATVDTSELWDGLGTLAERVYPEHGAFNRWRVSTLRELTQRGLGRVRVLLDSNGVPVSAVGAFSRNGIARFSGVITDPRYRQRGCASYLIAATLRDFRDINDRIVIAAETGSDAERLYVGLGFEPFATICSLVVKP
ncbi:MAG TPA: GNAT family N-acetyltransferase [Verrucomicrobiae bacterium]|jgi:GNAT superfamily N-acetyltransferase|nr:GNAT family N-acetyltransferase [Verrucomicrobiae bacterium]